MSALWQLKRLLPLGIGGVAVASFVAGTSPNTGDVPPLDSIERVAQGAPAQAICDVDGVDVSYHTTYRSEPDHGYDVVEVVVEDVNWPSCSSARLLVALTLDGGEVATGGVESLASPTGDVQVDPYVGSGASQVSEAKVTMPLRIAPDDAIPDAADAVEVAVELEGGITPIPQACIGMRFGTVQVGTLGNDKITGTNPAGDLIYGLQGADTITSLQGDDCVDTEADDTGDDTVTLGNGRNVVSTGAGDDTIMVGNGSRNQISAGAGNDTITVGNGKSNVIDGGLGENVCYVPKSVKPAWITIDNCDRIDT